MKRPTLTYKEDDLQLITKNPIESAREISKELEKQCDIIIALAHMTSFQINKLVAEVPEIDVVVGTHDYSRRAAPVQLENGWLLQTGSKGQYMGDMKILLDSDKQIISTDGVVESLDKSIPDDPAFAQMVKQFDQEYEDALQNELRPTQN